MKQVARSHDQYLETVGEDQRMALQELWTMIQEAAPRAQEIISYRLPAFRLDGKILVAYGATKNHCASYLMSSTTLEHFGR